MISCPNCHAPNRDGAHFCSTCGYPLPQPSPMDALAEVTVWQGPYCVLGLAGEGQSNRVDGQTLDTLIQQKGGQPFDEPTVIRWGIRVCDTLAVLHEHKTPQSFGDLRPGNIIIDQQGDAHLLDLNANQNVALSYAAMGAYGIQAGPPGDLYALAALIHRLLAGCEPPPGQAPASFELIRRLNPRVSLGMQRVLARALNPSPVARYTSARDLRQVLHQLLPIATGLSKTGEPRPIKPHDFFQVWAGRVARGLVVVLGCGAVVAVLAIAARVLSPGLTPKSTATLSPVVTLTRTATPTVTASPTRTATPLTPTRTPVASDTPVPSTSPGPNNNSVANLRANLEGLKSVVESSHSDKFACDAYARYFNAVVNSQCAGCQPSIDRMREGGGMLYSDCEDSRGPRSVQPLKIGSAKSAVYDALGMLPVSR